MELHPSTASHDQDLIQICVRVHNQTTGVCGVLKWQRPRRLYLLHKLQVIYNVSSRRIKCNQRRLLKYKAEGPMEQPGDLCYQPAASVYFELCLSLVHDYGLITIDSHLPDCVGEGRRVDKRGKHVGSINKKSAANRRRSIVLHPEASDGERGLVDDDTDDLAEGEHLHLIARAKLNERTPNRLQITFHLPASS
eukprot:XP_001706484.1 Hypothetical protein GL50803_32239 [Giardia lamblia ATCC 50803]